MSIEKMDLVTLTGSFDSLDQAAALCLQSGCFQIEAVEDYLKNLEGASRIVEENGFKQPLHRLKAIISSMESDPDWEKDWEDVPSSPVSLSEIETEIAKIEEHIGQTHSQRSALSAEAARLQTVESQLEHFSGLDMDLQQVQNTRYVTVRFGRLPVESYRLLDAYQNNPHILFIPVSHDKNYYWGVYTAPTDYISDADRVFAGLFFERLEIPKVDGQAKDAIEHCRIQRQKIQEQLAECDRLAAEYWQAEREHCLEVYARLAVGNKIFDIRQSAVAYSGHDRRMFILRGWIPARKRKEWETFFQDLPDLELTFETPEDVKQLDPPVKLKNHRVFRPYEFYVEMFGVPKYNEIDPTVFVAITYTVLYGIMFADVGQGILLAIAGWVMSRKMKMALGRILIPCGISGTLFGLVFGSVFGFEHLLDPMYHALGFHEKPIEVMASSSMMTILIVAIVIGVGLMYVAMGLNIYSCLRQRNIGGAIFGQNGLVGMMLYSGIVLTLLSLVFPLGIPTAPIILGGILVPVILLWVQEPLIKLCNRDPDWQPESWGGYLVEGFFEAFEAFLSYVTNTFSFLRVGAFVLVHASMMMVFFTIGEMIGGVGNAIMIVLGNIIVLALEGLLVGVQSLRLEFYEMFSRFYEGSGKAYTPVSTRE